MKICRIILPTIFLLIISPLNWKSGSTVRLASPRRARTRTLYWIINEKQCNVCLVWQTVHRFVCLLRAGRLLILLTLLGTECRSHCCPLMMHDVSLHRTYFDPPFKLFFDHTPINSTIFTKNACFAITFLTTRVIPSIWRGHCWNYTNIYIIHTTNKS